MTKEDKQYLDLLQQKLEQQHDASMQSIKQQHDASIALMTTEFGASVTLMTTEFERVNRHFSILNGRVGTAEERVHKLQGDCKDFRGHIALSKKIISKWYMILIGLLVMSFAGAWLYDNLDLKGTLEKRADIELRAEPGGGRVR